MKILFTCFVLYVFFSLPKFCQFGGLKCRFFLVRPELSITKLPNRKVLKLPGRGCFLIVNTRPLKKGPKSIGKSGSKTRILFSVMVCFGPNDLNCVIAIVLRPARQKTRQFLLQNGCESARAAAVVAAILRFEPLRLHTTHGAQPPFQSV